ncbi:MAG: hypothetical protein AB1522_13805 [Chloroflexota bacterium]
MRRAREAGVETALGEMQGAEDGLSQRFQRLIVLQEQAANQSALWQDVLNGWWGLIGEAEQKGEELLAANARGNLANTCLRLYEVTGNPAWADQAENLFQTINQFFTREKYPQAWGIVQHSLGNLFLDRYERSGEETQARLAEQYYQEVRQLAQNIPLPAVFPFRACTALVRLNFRRGNWQEVRKFSQEAREHLEELLALQSEQSSSESWLAEVQGLPAQTAWALLQEASPNFHQIVETLEGGRG